MSLSNGLASPGTRQKDISDTRRSGRSFRGVSSLAQAPRIFTGKVKKGPLNSSPGRSDGSDFRRAAPSSFRDN